MFFKEAAKYSGWTTEDKLDNFFRCLKGTATDYYAKLPKATRKDYKKLIKQFGNHFNTQDFPMTSRWEAMNLKQREDESLYEYKLRVQDLLRRAYSNPKTESTIGVEIFLRGMTDKTASLAVVQKKPKSIDKAYTMAKSMIALSKGLGADKKSSIWQ